MLTYKMAIVLRPQICDITSPYVYKFTFYLLTYFICFKYSKIDQYGLKAVQQKHYGGNNVSIS